MQHQTYDDTKILKREDELLDISKMPKEQLDAIAAKPAYTQTDAPASQSTTMQSVSMNEVPREGQEDILGSVASIHDQMQPGSFMSPISDRKSGSLEHISTEDKGTSTEPGFFKEGVEAVKDAFYINKEERAEIKDAIVTEAKALGEAASYFVNVAAEKVEGIYQAAAGKVSEIYHSIEKKAAEMQTDFSHSHQSQETLRKAEQGAGELKETLAKKAYLARKSLRRNLGKGKRQLEIAEKKAAMGAGFAKVYLREEAKDLKKRAKRFTKDWKKDSSDSKGALKASISGKARKFEKEAKKDAALAKEYIKHETSGLQEKAQAFGSEFISESNKAIDIIKQEGGKLQNKAKAYLGELKQENQSAIQGIKDGANDLIGQARRYERDFSEDFIVSDYLRAKASYLRSGARRIINEISRSTFIAGGKPQGKPQGSEESSKFLLDFSASEWNNTSFDNSRFSDNTQASGYLLEIPASEWNFSGAEASRQRAGFLHNRAQGWMNRASEEFSIAQKKLQSSDLKKDGRRLYNQASKKAGEVQSMIKNSVNQMIDSATERLADSSDKLNRQFPSQQRATELKQEAKGFMDQATQMGKEFLENVGDAAEKAKKYMIEKKSDLTFQAELLTQDRFPSQEALAKKQAINSEIRNFHKDSNKENLL